MKISDVDRKEIKLDSKTTIILSRIETEKDGNLPDFDTVSLMKLVPNDGIMGIDPGNKMGITCIYNNHIEDRIICVEAITTTIKHPMERSNRVRRIVEEYCPGGLFSAFVENSAFGARYGQTVLAENRLSAMIALQDMGASSITFAAPTSIRKVVFGSSKIKAESLWKEIPPDAASSLAIAVYGLLINLNNAEP
jgi:hypothetical protein